MIKILIVEDLEHLRKILRADLEREGFKVDDAADLRSATWKVMQGNYDIFVVDLILPDGSGISLLEKFPEKMSSRTIIVTANPTIPGVVESIKKGAYNYLEKPVEPELLSAQINQIIQLNRLRSEHRSMSTEMGSNFNFDSIVFESKAMENVINRAKILAGTNNTILLQGETGSGKEVLAHAIHNHSNRKNKVFIPINCAAIPHDLFESELFGFKKGAFTGAASDYSGRFIQADKGTLFLDEIGEFPLSIQPKLLRILDEKSIYGLKSLEPISVDVRIITATNRDLLQEIKAKQFRSDLYYRLQESTIAIPPLREREEDIIPLLKHFIEVYNHVYQKEVCHISRDVEQYFLNHKWEGNVRELKNTVKSIIPFKSNDTIVLDDLPTTIVGGKSSPKNKLLSLEEFEGEYILKILKISNFNISRAAETLGITRARLYRKISQFDLLDSVEDEGTAILDEY